MAYCKNINRGYMKLVVWKDAKLLYRLTWKIFRRFDYKLHKIVANHMSSIDSVHRNISEGNCRRGIREYLQFLNIALSSLGETISAMHVCYETHDIDKKTFEEWDALAFKPENGLIKLIRSLQEKKQDGNWKDSFIAKEPDPDYGNKNIDHSSNSVSLNKMEKTLDQASYGSLGKNSKRAQSLHYYNIPEFQHSKSYHDPNQRKH